MTYEDILTIASQPDQLIVIRCRTYRECSLEQRSFTDTHRELIQGPLKRGTIQFANGSRIIFTTYDDWEWKARGYANVTIV